MPFDAHPRLNIRDKDAELFAALRKVDEQAAPIFAKRRGSWVPAGWDLSESIALANEHRLRGEDR